MYPKIDFYEGHIFLNNLQVSLMPLNSFICILNEIIKNENKKIVILNMLNAVKDDTQIIINNIPKNISKIEIIKRFISIINQFGIGKVNLKQLNSNKIIFIEDKQFLTKNYIKIYGKKPKLKLEFIIFSYLINLIENLFNKKIQYKFETQYNQSILQINLTDLKTNKSKNNKNYNCEIKKKVKPSPILQKIILNKQIIIKNGKVSLWNTYATFIPLLSLINFTSKLSKKYESFFEGLGAMQGKAAVGLQKKIFGIKKELMFKQIIEQTELIGIGKSDFKLNNNKLIFKLNNNLLNHYSQFYNKNEIYLIQILFESLIKGAYDFSFNINTTKIKNENKNILKNNSKPRILNKKEKNIDKYINTKTLIVKPSELLL